ncbi:NYN domain-containing protein [Kocuria sp.]|uniref:NYN domain-containing protein n=1 Tax=Kocuria sp. TaxID=1871328 RepID=UPI0026DF58F3|nr:NYN domain-containing protein [Kocuria sp.]MDO5367677.1 NYN domain-containing protein [Kocuria sp.]
MFHEQSVIFIDAGFLLSAGSSTVTGTSLRAATRVDAEQLISGIVSITRDNCNLDPLRIYWYDASRDGVLSDWHKKISLLDDVKVRLGRIGVNGQQKGVDLRLGLDLIEVARNGSAKVAYLLSGDDDLAEAVEAAQDLGMKVVLLALEDKNRYLGIKSVAEHLAYKVDRILVLPQELIHSTFTPATRAVVPGSEAGTESTPPAAGAPLPGPSSGPTPVTPATLASKKATFITVKEPDVDLPRLFAVAEEVAERLARNWYQTTPLAEVQSVLEERPILPTEIDSTLLRDCAARIGEADTDLQSVRKHLRKCFWDTIDTLA